MIPLEVYKSVRRLEIRTRRLLGGHFTGLNASRFRGAGLAFETVRPYEPGDDVRAIDWKVTAKTGEPFVKVFSEERERTFWLVMDYSRSMDFGSGSRTKKQAAIEAAALLILHAEQQQDRSGLVTVTEQGHRCLSPARGRAHTQSLLYRLLNPETGSEAEERNDAGLLPPRLRKQRRQGIVIFLSDFLDPRIAEAMIGLQAQHHLLAIHLIDPWERDLPKKGLVRWHDVENGDIQIVDTSNNRVREDFRHQMQQREAELRRRFRKAGIAWIPVVTDRSPAQTLIERLGR